MSYESMTIAMALRQVNHSLFLPAIQRPYVWKQDAIIALFDSLMQGYPISSFLLWKIEPENRRQWAIYKFEANFRQGVSWNEKVEPDGRKVTFVLDGQQRLTSLLIGLQGSFTLREKYGRREKSTSYRAHHLYLDLFKDPADIDDDDEVTVNRYRFRFSDIAPRSDAKNLWIKVGDVLDLEEPAQLDAYRDRVLANVPERVPAERLGIAKCNLTRLHELAWKDHSISYYTERAQEADRVLSIFIRANEGGVKLSKSDLLMAVLETTWGENYVRDEILGLVDTLNRDMGRVFVFDKDLIMRACLVLTDLPNVYNVNNFTAHNMAVIRTNWDLIRRSLESTVALAAVFNLDATQLSSMNALIPIAYYLAQLDGARLDGTTPFETINRERIRRWLFSALFNGAFGGNSDQTIGVCRDVIREDFRHSRDFPIARLVSEMRTRRSRHLAFDDQGVRKLLDVSYGQRHCQMALGMLYDGQRAPLARYHVDHIIPTALLTETALRDKGVPGAKIALIKVAANRIGNLQLLIDRENLSKSDKDFRAWLQTRDHNFLETHLIPDDPHLWHPEALLEFVEARETLIEKALGRFLIFEDVGRSVVEAA